MSREHQEQCETCGDYNDVHDMHRVEIERVVGSISGRSRSHRQGSRHSTSFSGSSPLRIGNGSSNGWTSRSTSRTIKRRERVWVCNSCPDPVRPGRRFRRLVVFVAVVLAILWLVANFRDEFASMTGTGSGLPSTQARDGGGPETVPSTSRDDAAPAPTTAPTPPTIEPLPAPKSRDYPPCSATVTHHCVSG